MSRLQLLICISALCLQVASSQEDCGMCLYAAIVVKGSDLNVFEVYNFRRNLSK